MNYRLLIGTYCLLNIFWYIIVIKDPARLNCSNVIPYSFILSSIFVFIICCEDASEDSNILIKIMGIILLLFNLLYFII
jgi:hypothetical protein